MNMKSDNDLATCKSVCSTVGKLGINRHIPKTQSVSASGHAAEKNKTRKGDRVSGKGEEAGRQCEGWLHWHPEFAPSLEERGEDMMKPEPPCTLLLCATSWTHCVPQRYDLSTPETRGNSLRAGATPDSFLPHSHSLCLPRCLEHSGGFITTWQIINKTILCLNLNGICYEPPYV